MSLLLQDNPQEIYQYFTTKLSKAESIFLIGYYYFNNNSIHSSDNEFRKYKIIGQQFLTFSLNNPLSYKKYNFSEEDISLTLNDFYSDSDTLNNSINNFYYIASKASFNIENIANIYLELNDNLNTPIKFTVIEDKNKSETIPTQINTDLQELETKILRSIKRMNTFDKENFLKFINLFKGIPSILNLSNLSVNESVLLRQINTSNLDSAHHISPSYDGIWINTNEEKVRALFLIKTIQLLVKKGGLIFLSFPYREGGLKKNDNGTLLECNLTSFTTYLKNLNVPHLKIHTSWVYSYVAPGKKKIVKTFNVILKKI